MVAESESTPGRAPAQLPAAAPAAPQETIVYAAGGGRTTAFSFLFLILLPFFVSLPAMISMRVANGLSDDALGLAVLALAFGIVMFIVVVELLFSLRARVELGDKAVKMTLPTGRGPTPMLLYKSHEVPYDQIHTVETRREIYGGILAPVLLKGARLILKDGQAIQLGYVSEANVDPAFPFPEIARKIADRARLPLIDRGNVRRSLRRKMLGFKSGGVSETDTIDESQIAVLNRNHSNVVLALVGLFVVLIGLGIADDVSSGGLQGDWGDRPTAATTVPVSDEEPEMPRAKPPGRN